MIRAHAALLLALASPALAALPVEQTLSVDPSALQAAVGELVTVTVVYDSDDPTVAGVGLRLHYDSSKLLLRSTELLHPTGLFGRQDQPDAGDPYFERFDDGNPATDRRYIASWHGWESDWPGEATGLPLNLLRLHFEARGGAAATPLTLTGSGCAVCTLDVDGGEVRIEDGARGIEPTATPEASATVEPTAEPATPTPTPSTTPTPSLDPPTAGAAVPPMEIPEIPTLSELGMLLLVAALAGSAVVMLFRDRR